MSEFVFFPETALACLARALRPVRDEYGKKCPEATHNEGEKGAFSTRIRKISVFPSTDRFTGGLVPYVGNAHQLAAPPCDGKLSS